MGDLQILAFKFAGRAVVSNQSGHIPRPAEGRFKLSVDLTEFPTDAGLLRVDARDDIQREGASRSDTQSIREREKLPGIWIVSAQ